MKINGLPKVFVISTNGIEGGASIHVETMVNFLSDQFNFVLIFGSDGPVVERLRLRGFTCEVIKELNNHFNILSDIRAITKIKRLVDLHKPTLLHLHSSKAGLLGRMVGLITRTPIVFTVHGWGWRGMSFIKQKLIQLVERVFSFFPSQFFIYVAKSVESEAINLLRIDKNKGVVILNGTNDFLVNTSKSEVYTIIMPARVSNAKDHISLIKAFEKLDFESRLILCGHGTDDESFILEMIQFAPSRHKHIEFLGSQADMKPLLNQSHVFALISNFEALPLSIIEAMSASMPIIASNVGGVSELVEDGKNGFLIDNNDVDGIIKSINQLQNESLTKTMGDWSRAIYLNNFSSQKMCSQIVDVYSKMGRVKSISSEKR